MAGYIFSLDSIESLKLYTTHGIYSTKISEPNGMWKAHHEAVFGEYSTMKAGDNIYFFIKRKIYGIGELVEISDDCKFSNYPGACEPKKYDYNTIKTQLIWDEADFSVGQRWVCVFKPSPHFFTQGIDMDDVLSSNPSAFKTLRAFWKVSFIKFDDEENQAFKDVILKFNQEALSAPQTDTNVFASDFENQHRCIEQKKKLGGYELDIKPILATCSEDDYLRHEMALEAGILYQLSYKDEKTIKLFGTWDYLSHQVIASPFKPIDYMDKMDLFGYNYIQGFDPTRSKFLVAELKKNASSTEDIEQLLKYVDWVKDEYCHGDYSMIVAFLVAYEHDDAVTKYVKEQCKRQYIVGRRPARSLEWRNLKLVKYSFNKTDKIEFELVN